ncbi:dirigent protein 19-like [Abrus precatorius]|uniref:Dirigent protein n=1 Tax=Abrus precatorius TaxID=3816 RepID=A0A8B8L7K8_ABRPR|nr:dirigent protein 19-like [Abrus precatorius]
MFTQFLITLLIVSVTAKNTDDMVRQLDPKLLSGLEEKLSHFRFYWHDTLSGHNPSSVTVIPSPLKLNSTTVFGLVNIFENPLTLGPHLSSKLVGKAQGFYASTSQSEVDMLVAMNFAFTEGKYNGSSITILGRDPIFNEVREMPVIGGTGLFRFARGYAQLRTHSFLAETKDAVVEYNVYVLHY